MKELWQMTFGEFVSFEGANGVYLQRDTARDYNRIIQQALSEGKPVPAEVIADTRTERQNSLTRRGR